jgi:hypothetical protein
MLQACYASITHGMLARLALPIAAQMLQRIRSHVVRWNQCWFLVISAIRNRWLSLFGLEAQFICTAHIKLGLRHA